MLHGSKKFEPNSFDKEFLHFLKQIFNMEKMKKYMSELSLDLDKMPIGSLTMEKVNRCHKILCEIQKILVN